MTARLSFGRALAVAGVVTAVAVPFTAGSAFADTQPHHPSTPVPSTSHQPVPVPSTSHQPAPGHSTGHQPAPGHGTGHQPAPGHGTGHQPGMHHTKVATLRTRVRDAHIRTSPTADRHSRSISTLRMRGSKVAVTCYTNGARVDGSNIWFETVAPARGFISSSEVGRPVHPVGRCK